MKISLSFLNILEKVPALNIFSKNIINIQQPSLDDSVLGGAKGSGLEVFRILNFGSAELRIILIHGFSEIRGFGFRQNPFFSNPRSYGLSGFSKFEIRGFGIR